jgi:hypothetical protein
VWVRRGAQRQNTEPSRGRNGPKVGQAHPQAGHCGGGIRKNPRLVRTHRPGSVIEQVYERQESGNSSKLTRV